MAEVSSPGHWEMVTPLTETASAEVGVGIGDKEITDHDAEDAWRSGGAGGTGLEGTKRRSLRGDVVETTGFKSCGVYRLCS